MPFGSERHVHKFKRVIKIAQNAQKTWYKEFICEFCPQTTKIALDYIPLQIPTIGIYQGDDNNWYVKSGSIKTTPYSNK